MRRDFFKKRDRGSVTAPHLMKDDNFLKLVNIHIRCPNFQLFPTCHKCFPLFFFFDSFMSQNVNMVLTL